MSLPTAVAAAMFLGVIVYALLAGADFGSGFYDFTAGEARPAERYARWSITASVRCGRPITCG